MGIPRLGLDTTRPEAEVVTKPAHGDTLTAATLKGGGDWDTAEARSGSQHLLRPPARFEAHSPFNYAAQAEVLIVTDIKKGDIAAMSGAYARLIEAAQGDRKSVGSGKSVSVRVDHGGGRVN